jgi:hypothetical protein
LKELDWDSFQRLCFQLLAEKHPSLAIKHVEGAGGDRGLDLFLGELRSRPAVWQCKHFPNALGARQRPQVLESLRVAVKNFNPQIWILVLPTDLDSKGHQWFQKLKRSYSNRTELGFLQGSDIVRELIYRRRLRESFFPGAVIDTIMVRRGLSDLGERSTADLDGETREKLDEMIARLEEADARFNYRVVYGADVGKDIAEQHSEHPLLIASAIDNDKRIDIFARDLTSLKLDPPTVKFTAHGTGSAKIQEFLRTGLKQELGVEEISNLKSTFDFLLPDGEVQSWGLVLMPSEVLKKRRLKLRLTFAKGRDNVIYDYAEFKVVRAGTDEAEIESVSIPAFALSLTFSLTLRGEGVVIVTERFVGTEVRAANKAITALSLLRTGGRLELFALEPEKPLGVLEISQAALYPHRDPNSTGFGSSRAQQIMTSRATSTASKRLCSREGSFTNLAENVRVDWGVPSTTDCSRANASSSRLVILSGTRSSTPVTLSARSARIDKPAEFRKRYSRAKNGTGVPITFTAEEISIQTGTAHDKILWAKPSLKPIA